MPRLLNARSAEYFQQGRERTLKKSLEQVNAELQRPGQDQEMHNAMTPYVLALTVVFQENDTGPSLMGEAVSYAGLVVVAWIRFYQELGYWYHFLAADPGPLRLLYDSTAAWLSTDDH